MKQKDDLFFENIGLSTTRTLNTNTASCIDPLVYTITMEHMLAFLELNHSCVIFLGKAYRTLFSPCLTRFKKMTLLSQYVIMCIRIAFISVIKNPNTNYHQECEIHTANNTANGYLEQNFD